MRLKNITNSNVCNLIMKGEKMSKFETLLEKLCPHGVEYKNLEYLCGTITTGKLNANAMVENGQYPFFTCDSKPFKINKYAFDEEAILISGNGSQVGHINYYNGKFNAYQRTYVIYNFKEINVKFLLHFLTGYLKEYILKNCKKGSVPYITLPMLQKFSVPVPPLEVQCEIVHILDDFTLLSAELSAELKARKKQYQYYIDYFYALENKKHLDGKIYQLDEVGELIRGKRFVHADAVLENGIPAIHYGELYTYYGVIATETKSQIRKDIPKKLRYAKKGDIVIVGAGENNVDIGVGVAWLGDYEVAVHDACYIFHPSEKVLSEYISFYLRADMYHQQIKKYVSEGKICAISAQGIGKSKIYIPSIEEQKKVIKILKNFDKLNKDIISGLPAEIETRKKQYEYYRDKLLTFKELKTDE